MKVTTRIFEMLKEQGKTQKELAEHLKTGTSTITGWKQENRNPSLNMIIPICEFFNISPEYLLRGVNPNAPYSWDAQDVKDGLSRLSSVVVEMARSSDKCSMKMAYDILIDLRHILGLNPATKPAAMILLQESLDITTKFIDSYLNAINRDRIDEIKAERAQDFVNALSDFEFELSSADKNK